MLSLLEAVKKAYSLGLEVRLVEDLFHPEIDALLLDDDSHRWDEVLTRSTKEAVTLVPILAAGAARVAFLIWPAKRISRLTGEDVGFIAETGIVTRRASERAIQLAEDLGHSGGLASVHWLATDGGAEEVFISKHIEIAARRPITTTKLASLSGLLKPTGEGSGTPVILTQESVGHVLCSLLGAECELRVLERGAGNSDWVVARARSGLGSAHCVRVLLDRLGFSREAAQFERNVMEGMAEMGSDAVQQDLDNFYRRLVDRLTGHVPGTP